MSKEQVQKVIVTLIAFLLTASAIGYLFFPSAMLSIVGIKSNDQMDFLVRTLAADLVALIPSAWSVRKSENSTLHRSVLLGLAIYMFLSSAVDLHAFLSHLVNAISAPSIVLRVLIGGVLLWIMPRG